MLYLVKLDSVYKIGFSKNVEARIKQFEPTHLDVELISTKFGNQNDESQIHLLCKDYHIKNELFKQDDDVIKIFDTYISNQLKNNIDSVLEENSQLRLLNKKYEELSDNLIESGKCKDDIIRNLVKKYNDPDLIDY